MPNQVQKRDVKKCNSFKTFNSLNNKKLHVIKEKTVRGIWAMTGSCMLHPGWEKTASDHGAKECLYNFPESFVRRYFYTADQSTGGHSSITAELKCFFTELQNKEPICCFLLKMFETSSLKCCSKWHEWMLAAVFWDMICMHATYLCDARTSIMWHLAQQAPTITCFFLPLHRRITCLG